VSYGNEKAFFSHFKDESFSFSDLKGSIENVVDNVASPESIGDGALSADSADAPSDPEEASPTTVTPTAVASTTVTPTAITTSQLDTADPPDRDNSIEGGIELLYETDLGEVQSQLLTDISSTHDGAEWWFSYGHPFQSGNFKISPAVFTFI
jgi:hypothetical protein